MLEGRFYVGGGQWAACVPDVCGHGNHDWGDDSLTTALYLHWRLTHDAGALPIMKALAATATTYTPRSNSWSDTPLWDAVADAREYEVTGSPAALRKAEAAFAFVDSGRRAAFAAGACPGVDYQQPGGGANRLKTLETDSNYVKAALLLHGITHAGSYLAKAEAKYAAVRRWFLDPATALYTVYLFDDGTRCTPLPARTFGSVNGNMIWDGWELAAATGDATYRRQALATAAAVERDLADGAGVYADLQAENDVTEPLVEAMYAVATGPGGAGGQAAARAWLIGGAAASAAGVDAAGVPGRFFDGPAPLGTVTAWQANGGLALRFAAAALDPSGTPGDAGGAWAAARYVADDLRLGGAPVQFSFDGRAVAIVGTIGEVCCQAGHAEVFVDGRRTFDETGIWQDKSSSGRQLPGSILFAWRWRSAGRHTIRIAPAEQDPKEGGSFFHMVGYFFVP